MGKSLSFKKTNFHMHLPAAQIFVACLQVDVDVVEHRSTVRTCPKAGVNVLEMLIPSVHLFDNLSRPSPNPSFYQCPVKYGPIDASDCAQVTKDIKQAGYKIPVICILHCTTNVTAGVARRALCVLSPKTICERYFFKRARHTS